MRAAPWILILLAASTTATAVDSPPAPADSSATTVVVKADKLDVETRIDRKIYTVTEDAQSTFGTLSDILSVIPSVDIDPDGVVSLRGDSNVYVGVVYSFGAPQKGKQADFDYDNSGGG